MHIVFLPTSFTASIRGLKSASPIKKIPTSYLDQYDVGIFLMGDADFKPLIEAVKDVGKKTMCISYPENSAKELTRTFDMRETLTLNEIKQLATTHLTS